MCSAQHGCHCVQVKANEQKLIAKGISAKRVQSMQTDLAHRMGAVQDGGLAWGAFTFRKPANSQTLIIGGGPLGALVAMRMSQSGVSNVTLKVCASTQLSIPHYILVQPATFWSAVCLTRTPVVSFYFIFLQHQCFTTAVSVCNDNTVRMMR